jgi:hypothetical protein
VTETWREKPLKGEKESLKEERENDTVFCSIIDYRPYRIIFTWHNMRYRIRDNSVGIATDYGLDCRVVRVRVLVGPRSFSSLRLSDRSWGPPCLSNGTGGSFSGSKADHSSPTSAEVKNKWIYTTTPPYAFMAQCLIS